MPRRATSRLRGPFAGGSGVGTSDEETTNALCPPLPPSPGKRKTRSPVEEIQGGPAAPSAMRCMAFQSPKKKALGAGMVEKFNAPLDKENDLVHRVTNIGGGALVFADGGRSLQSGGSGTFRLSAFSAFSQAPKSSISLKESAGRRRNREDAPTRAPPRTQAPPRVVDIPKGSPLPFLLAPVSLSSSPDLSNKSSSRRTRGSSRLARSRDSSSCSSSASNGSASPALTGATASTVDWRRPAELEQLERNRTPRQRRGQSLSGAGCAAGGKRAMGSSAAKASHASPPAAKSTSGSGGGPAGACCAEDIGYDSLPEVDRSPLRSPVHRLTESLQKWAPGSRYARAISTADEGTESTTGGGGGGSSGGDAVRSSPAGDMDTTPGVTVRAVGASWSGQELRHTLDQERAGVAIASQRRPRSHTEEVVCPQQSFRDSPAYSPISPASSVASINLANDSGAGGELAGFSYSAGTPPSAGRSWPSSPAGTKCERNNRHRGRDGGGGGPAGAVERFASTRMEESWLGEEEDEDGNRVSATMRLAFSPRDAGEERGGAGSTRLESSASRAALEVSARTWASPFSPVTESRPLASEYLHRTVTRGSLATGTGGGRGRATRARGRLCSAPEASTADYLASPSSAPRPSGVIGGDNQRRRDMPNSPEEHSLHSVRDLMDDGTGTDEEDGSRGGRTAFVRRRRRRTRPELALRTLEMPDAADLTVVEDVGAATAGSAEAELTTGNVAAGKTPISVASVVGFGSGCATACSGWVCNDTTNGNLETTMDPQESTVNLGDESWIESGGGREMSEKQGGDKDQEQDQSSAFGVSAEEGGQASLGISGFSAADTSGASDSSTSFVKSRPIPDQSAFTSSRMNKGGAGAPLSPLGCSTGGGPAASTAAAPLCVTPRKSVMRCPPTPQRTPTWDGLEDSLLLEGAGSGGRGSGRSSGRRSLRRINRSGAADSSSDGTGDTVSDAEPVNISGARTACLLAAAAGPCLDENDTDQEGIKVPSGGCGSSNAGIDATPARRGRGDGTRRGGRGCGAGKHKSSGNGCGARVHDSAARRDAVSGSRCGPRWSEVTARAEGGAGWVRRGGDGVERGASTGNSGGGGDGNLGFKHDFVQMGPIGEGGFSVVWKVCARGSGRLYAIKRSKREFRGRRDRDRCLLEARALQRLGEHPGVLRFERAWQEEGHFCLQTELCELGTLKDFLERLPSRREIPEAAIWQILHDVGQALRHVHATGLVHLDVKPANLLIGDEGGRLKLADFGMATTYGEGVEGVGDGQEGDTLYMAKELLSSTERLPSADIFSLGLTIYEVATRLELPGDGEDWHAMRDGRACALPPSRSQELGSAVRQLMHPDPERRPTAASLCEHSRISLFANTDHKRDDYVYSQARAWRAAEAAAMDHPSNGLRTPTGDVSVRYVFQQTG